MQTALITGAAKRIGKAISLHLAEQGWNICVHYNSSGKDAESLINLLSNKYPNQKFCAINARLENEPDVENLITNVLSECGPFQLLINNASVFKKATISDTKTEHFNYHFNVNFKAPFLLTREFAKCCKTGNIINFVDTRIGTNQPGFSAYTLSKKALWELTKMAAVEFAPAIRVNAIAPGVTLPPEDKDLGYLKILALKTPMKTPSGIEPVLKCIDFILGNNHLTGQLLYVDGGENLAPLNL
jgi:NAD(P)-dependent dehydrogenase (short-subunit alcohol dehydrogenase family)